MFNETVFPHLIQESSKLYFESIGKQVIKNRKKLLSMQL